MRLVPYVSAVVLLNVLPNVPLPCQRILLRELGDADRDYLGSDVRPAGDVDGDGSPDVLAIALRTTGQIPYVRVHSGRTGAVLHTFRGLSATEGFGFAACGGADFNGDGFDDIAISILSRGSGGEVEVYSGRTGGVLWRFGG